MSEHQRATGTNEIHVPKWFSRLTSDIDSADSRARAIAEDLSTAQLNWRPSDQAWSIGQCLEHLAISNEVYTKPIAEALASAPSGSADDISPGWFGRWFIRTYIEPTTQKRRYRAPKKAAPVTEQLDSSILNRFIASNAAIREVASRARRCDVNRVRFTNPFVPVIRFTVGTGLHILARHNHRHLLQAERVKQGSGFPR